MIIEICHSDLKAVVERVHDNFSRLKPGKPGTTEPWRSLQSIGLSSKDINENFTGTVTIFVQRGGILNADEFGKLPLLINRVGILNADEIVKLPAFIKQDGIPNSVELSKSINKILWRDAARTLNYAYTILNAC